MKKISNQSLTKAKNTKPNSATKTPKQNKMTKSQVLETSGGRMPDSSQHTNITETDVRYAFRKEKDNTKNK